MTAKHSGALHALAVKTATIAIQTGRRLQQCEGWRRYATAAGMGALTATAFAPYYFLPGMIAGFTSLVLLIDSTQAARAPKHAAFFTGLAFGFGYFLVSMYWLAFAFLVEADSFAWMIPVAVPGLMAFLGLFIAIPVLLVSFRWGNGIDRAILLALALSIFEVLRGTLFTGLPWNIAGQAVAGGAWLAQPAAWFGPYGLSLLVLLIAILPAGCWSATKDGPFTARPLHISLTILIAVAVFGLIRLTNGPIRYNNDVTVAIMQPNVPQRDKGNPRLNDDHFGQLLEDTQKALPATGESYAIWPENAYPFLAQAEDAPEYFAGLFPVEAHIITGTYRTFDSDTETKYANSAVVFGSTVDGKKPLLATYDKHHLVPFGEYLPFKGILKAIGLAQLAPVEDGFTPGPGPAILNIGTMSFAPLICFEDVFPGQLYPPGSRPDWLVVVTNDAWFGDNAGPKQHLDIARLRAIESGLPMARSANTGISALIGPRGRTISEIPLYTRNSIIHKLPTAANPTLYDRFKNVPFVLLLLAIFGWFTRTGLARSS